MSYPWHLQHGAVRISCSLLSTSNFEFKFPQISSTSVVRERMTTCGKQSTNNPQFVSDIEAYREFDLKRIILNAGTHSQCSEVIACV